MTKFKIPSKEEARARFWELDAQEKAIREVSGPMRAERDAFVNRVREEEEVMNLAIREAEVGLFEIAKEKAQMAALAGSNVGRDPTLPPEEEESAQA